MFARFWLHNGMLNFGGSKMSKSVGNVSVLHDLLEKHPAEALRLALLSAHYRQPLDWSDTLIEQSVKTLDRLYGTLRDLADVDAPAGDVPDAIEKALSDDLNTPLALAELAKIAGHARKAESLAEKQRTKAQLLGAGAALGLLQSPPQTWFGQTGSSADDSVHIQAMIDERNLAKQRKDFAAADAIRKQLLEQGIAIEDTAQGVRWKRV